MRQNSFDAAYAQAAREIVLKNYRYRLSIPDIASQIGLSEKTLQRAFRNEYKIGLYGFILKVRMEKAKEYLEDRKPVKQVAGLVGYKRHSSFTKQFSKYFGVAPSNWETN